MDMLIVGGSGFVSGTLARVAISLGHRVWCLTRGTRRIPEGAHHLIADRKETKGFEDAIIGAGIRWDLAVDCICFDADDAQQDLEVIAPMSSSLVIISTDFVYDPHSRTVPQNEKPAKYQKSGYGAQKREAELCFTQNSSFESWTILRPCHIYGPYSLLGCLPSHSRDSELINRINRGEALRLVNGGTYLQQPIFCPDLCQTIISCAGNGKANGQICNVAGPDIVESADYYRLIGEILGETVTIENIPAEQYLRENPERESFICDRVYDTEMLTQCKLSIPKTSIRDGLRTQITHLLE